jgi:hypothetical protein
MGDIYKQAKTDKAVLKIWYDRDAVSPREWDNLGHMICWHNNYNLGDEHSYSNPSNFIQELASELFGYDDVGYIKEKADAHMSNFRIAECKDSEYEGEYEILEKGEDGKEECYDEYGYTKENAEQELQNIREGYIDEIYNEMSDEELYDLIQQKTVILPLYLYDHSGITMNTSGFSCPWDSGRVGYIYMTHEEIEKEYGDTSKEQLEKVAGYLEGEVKTYDEYLRDDVYGFQLYKVDTEELHDFMKKHDVNDIKEINDDTLNYFMEEIDSCWGFYGDDIKGNGITDHIPKQYEELVNQLA